jgi:hypothetical protein
MFSFFGGRSKYLNLTTGSSMTNETESIGDFFPISFRVPPNFGGSQWSKTQNQVSYQEDCQTMTRTGSSR